MRKLLIAALAVLAIGAFATAPAAFAKSENAADGKAVGGGTSNKGQGNNSSGGSSNKGSGNNSGTGVVGAPGQNK
jgi:hypothetical protein